MHIHAYLSTWSVSFILQPLATAAATRFALPVATVQRTEYSAMWAAALFSSSLISLVVQGDLAIPYICVRMCACLCVHAHSINRHILFFFENLTVRSSHTHIQDIYTYIVLGTQALLHTRVSKIIYWVHFCVCIGFWSPWSKIQKLLFLLSTGNILYIYIWYGIWWNISDMYKNNVGTGGVFVTVFICWR